MKCFDLLFQTYTLIRSLSRRKLWRDLDRYPNQRYSIWLCVKLYLAIAFMGWTRNLFYEKLKTSGRDLRRLLKLPNDLPSYSQLKKRMKRPAFVEALTGVLSLSATHVLHALGREEVRVTLMDLTDIPSSRKDSHARLGTSDGKTWFWGYKLGIFMSRSGVVLGAALVTANWGERRVSGRLIRLARRTIQMSFAEVPVQYLLCDSGFTGEHTSRAAHGALDCWVVSPPRRPMHPKPEYKRRDWETDLRREKPHRYQDWRFWKTPTAKRVYLLRDEIDRRFSQITDTPFEVDHRPRGTVGVQAVLCYDLAKLILWNMALNENILKGRELRRVKAYVA